MSGAELATAMINTLLVASCVLAMSMPAAVFLSVTLVRTNIVAARLAWIILFSQLAVPLYAIVGAWSAGFGTQGWWPLGQVSVAGHRFLGIAVVAFIHSMAAIPGAVLILSIGLTWRQRSREELALVDGGIRNLTLRVLLPELLPWMAAAALWCMLPVFTEMVVTNLYQLPTLAEQVYLDISLGTSNSLTYVVSVLLCMLPMLVIVWPIHLWLMRRSIPQHAGLAIETPQHAPIRLPLGNMRWPLTVIAWSLVLLISIVPLVNLLIKSGWQTALNESGQLSHQWQLARALRTIGDTATLFTTEFQWTATLAAASSTTAITIALVLRWLTGRYTWLRATAHVMCFVLIAMPGPLVANLISNLFLKVPGLGWWYDHTLAAPILAQQSRLLPVAWFVAGVILSSVGIRARELAQVDGLSMSWRIKLLWFRPTWRRWLALWMFLATISAGELSTHLLLLPPGVATIAQRLFEFLHFGMRYQDSGLCLLLIALSWLAAILLWNTRSGRA